jgi:antitoxin component of MazEF toxin-antitoxin module
MAGIVARDGQLVRHGNDLALILDAEVLEQLHIDPDTSVGIVVDGDSLIVTVKDTEHEAKLHQIMEDMNKEYGDVFRRLAE